MHDVVLSRLAAGFSSAILGRALVSLGAGLIAACAHTLPDTPAVTTLPALELEGVSIDAASALTGVKTPDLLALTDEMRAFVDRYARHGNERQRLTTLHQSLRSPGLVDIRYDPRADGTAARVFESGAANCLSYAHMFIALARYAGLNAKYQSLALRPEWSRHGNQVALRRHVNVRVDMRNGEQYMVDIDPVSRARIASADLLSDDEAAALFYANRAMDALFDKKLETAFRESVRALQLGPGIDYLWVNLGAIYRQTGQDQAAEMAYNTALAVNGDSQSAMNNLAVLYRVRGDIARSRAWEQKVQQHRDQNPYYHYFLGESAEDAGDLETALSHYMTAISLKPGDAEFYYRVARVYHARHQQDQTVRFLEKAIERSRLVGERDVYRAFMKEVTEGMLASVDLNG